MKAAAALLAARAAARSSPSSTGTVAIQHLLTRTIRFAARKRRNANKQAVFRSNRLGTDSASVVFDVAASSWE